MSGGDSVPPRPNECGLKRWIIIAALILFCMVFAAAVVDALVKAVLIIPEGPFAYLPDYLGSLLPGIIFHLVNNFFCLAILNYENTVMPTASLFLAVGEASGGEALLSEFLMNTPMILYVIFLEVRRRKASARRS